MSPLSIKTLEAYSPPGNPSDLTVDNKTLWSKRYIAHWIQSEIHAVDPETGKSLEGPDGIIRTQLLQFFDGTVTPFDVDQTPLSITWTAFPSLVRHGPLVAIYHTVYRFAGDQEDSKGTTRWLIADGSRDYQDEYLEWSVARDEDDNVVIATFTCEGPEVRLSLHPNPSSVIDRSVLAIPG